MNGLIRDGGPRTFPRLLEPDMDPRTSAGWKVTAGPIHLSTS